MLETLPAVWGIPRPPCCCMHRCGSLTVLAWTSLDPTCLRACDSVRYNPMQVCVLLWKLAAVGSIPNVSVRL